MEDERKYVLIRTRRDAAVGFALTGFLSFQIVREIVSHAPTEPDPIASMLAFYIALPTWVNTAITILFYGFYG